MHHRFCSHQREPKVHRTSTEDLPIHQSPSVQKSARNQRLKLVYYYFIEQGGIKTKTGFLTLFSFPLGLNNILMFNPLRQMEWWCQTAAGISQGRRGGGWTLSRGTKWRLYSRLLLVFNPPDVFCLSGMYRRSFWKSAPCSVFAPSRAEPQPGPTWTNVVWHWLVSWSVCPACWT